MMIAMALATLVLGFVVYMIMKVTGFSGSMFGSARMGGIMNGGFNPQGAVIMMIFTAVVGFGVLALYAALFCYVIPLVVVSRQGLLEAMGNSFRASFKNLFVLFFFAVNAVVFMNLVLVPVFAIGVSSVSTTVMVVLALPTSLVWGSVLGGAYYFSFRDVLLADTSKPSDESLESTVPAENLHRLQVPCLPAINNTPRHVTNAGAVSSTSVKLSVDIIPATAEE